MISGANENELEIANARADIWLMCGSETLKVIDKYYEQQLEAYENMRKEEINYLHNLRNFKIKYNKKSATNPIEEELFASDKDFIKDLLNILNKVGGSDD